MTEEQKTSAFEIVSKVLVESSGGKISETTRETLARKIVEELEITYKLVRKSNQNLILFVDEKTGEVHYAGEPGLLTRAISQLVDLKIHTVGTRD